MKVSFDKYILLCFTLIFLAIIFLGTETYKSIKKYQETVRLIEHTQEVLYQSEQVLSINQDLETGTRGFILTNKAAFLKPFNTGKEIIFYHLHTLEKLTKDNSSQQKRVDNLYGLTVKKITFSDLAVKARKENFEKAKNLIMAGEGVLYMDSIRLVLNEIQKEENRLIKIRRQVNDKSNEAFNYSFLFQLVTIVFAIIISAAIIVINTKAMANAKALLIENQQLLQSIIDNTSLLIYVKDVEGKFILVNREFEKLVKNPQYQILGKTSFDFFPISTATKIREVELQVIKEERNIIAEEDLVQNGGTMNFLTTTCPLYDSKGSIYAVCGISTNITELKQQANLIHDLYNNAPCGYYSIDKNGNFLGANSTILRWLGYKKEELIGKSFRQILTEECKEDFIKTFPVFIETGQIIDKEYNLVKRDNSLISVLLNSSAVNDEQGYYRYSRSTVFDITERKELEDELKQVNKELESFTYSISHDLRAPLRIINGYAGIIAEDYAETLDEDGLRMVINIINNAERMGQLIDDLLAFSRLGRKELVKTSVDMDVMVKEIVEGQLRENKDEAKYKIRINNLGECICDSSLIKQVWENLISNAIKYSSKNTAPVIEISCTYKSGKKIFSIKDNGTGFDMKYYDKLFGVFQRLHKVSDYQGTGVGLALVQRIVIKHGGSIWAEAKVNEGATFFFTIL